MHRELLATYVLVAGGATAGLVVAILFFADSEPRVLMWIFGAGAGTMVGAFIAAIASNEPLIGGGSRREPLFPPPQRSSERPRGSLNGHGSTNGHSASYDDEEIEENEGGESVRRGGRST